MVNHINVIELPPETTIPETVQHGDIICSDGNLYPVELIPINCSSETPTDLPRTGNGETMVYGGSSALVAGFILLAIAKLRFTKSA